MTTKTIVKIAAIAVAAIGAVSLVSQHPVLVITMVVGVAAFYVAEKYL